MNKIYNFHVRKIFIYLCREINWIKKCFLNNNFFFPYILTYTTININVLEIARDSAKYTIRIYNHQNRWKIVKLFFYAGFRKDIFIILHEEQHNDSFLFIYLYENAAFTFVKVKFFSKTFMFFNFFSSNQEKV